MQQPRPTRKPLPLLLRELNRLYTKSLAVEFGEDAVTDSEWMVLRTLWHEQPLIQKDIAQRTGLWHSMVVTTIDSLEQKGLVQRARGKIDRRRTEVSVTEKGWAKRELWLPLAEKALHRSYEGLTPDDVRTLYSYILTLQANLRKAYGIDS